MKIFYKQITEAIHSAALKAFGKELWEEKKQKKVNTHNMEF